MFMSCTPKVSREGKKRHFLEPILCQKSYVFSTRKERASPWRKLPKKIRDWKKFGCPWRIWMSSREGQKQKTDSSSSSRQTKRQNLNRGHIPRSERSSAPEKFCGANAPPWLRGKTMAFVPEGHDHALQPRVCCVRSSSFRHAGAVASLRLRCEPSSTLAL